jgi:hemerythrin-like metal-binding protein
MPVSWKAEYSLGVAEIDSEHYRMIEMMNRLELVQDRPDALQTVWAVMKDVVDYIETHFKHEEALMQKSGYPALDAHKQQHKAFEARVLDLRAKGSLDAGAFHQFLQQWLTEHIMQVDRHYVPYVQTWLTMRDEHGGLE